MRIERTTDRAAVLRIVGHPSVKPLIWEGDDDPIVPIHESIYYLIGHDERFSDGAVEDVAVGVVAFLPVNSICWNPHVAVLPEHRGRGTELVSEALRWMRSHTPCRKIFAAPPAYNAQMIRVFEKCGFHREGMSPKSFQFRGEIFDRVLMGKEMT